MSKSSVKKITPPLSADDDAHIAELISGMQKKLLKRAPEAKTFAQQFFSRASYEDMSVYQPDDMTRFAENAFAHLQQRKPGHVALHITTDPSTRVTVIEVLNDNMPFLVDSVMSAMTELGHEIRLVLHPILNVSRDKAGKLTGIYGTQPPPFGMPVLRESFIYIHTDAMDDAEIEKLHHELVLALKDTRLVVQDWKPMLARLDQAIEQFKHHPPPIPVAELAEAIHFLEWLRNHNFTFLGLREYKVISAGRKLSVDPVDETGLGLLRDPEVGLLRHGNKPVTMTDELRHFLTETNPLIISKANLRSRVHRRVHIDYVGVKLFDSKGNMTGELRLAGLFTSTAYTSSARAIPYLRRKVETVLQRSGFEPDSHSGKALVNIVENYPRDELFQIDDDKLLSFSEKLLQLEERPRIRLLIRQDKFDRFASIMVYIPRDRYTSGTRAKIGDMLAEAYHGRVAAWNSSYPEGTLARLHFIIAKNETQQAEPGRADLEQKVIDLIRTWEDEFAAEIDKNYKNGEAKKLRKRYLEGFQPTYRDQYTPQEALHDIRILERLNPLSPLAIDFYRFADALPHELGLKVYHCGSPLSLSKRVPVLEAMGFHVISETSVEIMPDGRPEGLVVLHDLHLTLKSEKPYDFEAADHLMEDAFLAIWSGRAENDGYNALVLLAHLNWREVSAIRAMSRYLRQVRIPYSQDYMWETLSRNPEVAKDLFQLFKARFDPSLKYDAAKRQQAQDEIALRIETALQKVTSLDEDRILRRFLNLITCMLRTNFYARGTDGDHKPTISFKLESRRLEGLPEPKPLYEIFVFSPRVEGIHLRMGRVARGGLRWSDRPQDFRTEVLGLVKAQQVKNAVIVPVGSKGGFVPKKLPDGPRDAIQAEGVAAYMLFIYSLLEITDTINEKGAIEHPKDVLRHDADDPYLVVAADKGTATFSDIANTLSLSCNFWLGDAFASGGSAGYDHKAMAITARGAWEAVKRHFREMDTDIQSTPFTVVGVGDMSGDVFGNGMLLSKCTKLVAAFDHRDIFIDPEPDTAVSFKERERLFALPRSSWADYDAKLISKGGGIFSRSLKSIPLSPQMQALTGLKDKSVTPQVLMNALLKAQVDLLWFGGIGTYVRASYETDEQAGDRANDAIRISGGDIRAKVIGEGANLGMTQRARIEAAQHGVRLNTDAIDNSAGVNTSDVEVNIKIALGPAVRTGRLTLPNRNKLLQKMTDDVAALVLQTNYRQTLSISVSSRRGVEDIGFAERLMAMLEAEQRLSRKIEDLPSKIDIDAREKQGHGLTRPENAVLVSYAKLYLYDHILDSALPDDPFFANDLTDYFPVAMRKTFSNDIETHRLRREIIATRLSNAVIDRGGATVLPRVMDQTGASAPDAAAAFAVTSQVFDLPSLYAEIDALDTIISGDLQLQLYREVQDLVHDRMVWLLRHGDMGRGLQKTAQAFTKPVETLAAALQKVLPDSDIARLTARRDMLVGNGIPKALVTRLISLQILIDAPDIVLAAEKAKKPLLDAARAYFDAGELFSLPQIYEAVKTLNAKNYFERLALDRAIGDLSVANRRLAVHILQAGGLEKWKATKGPAWQRARQTLDDIVKGPDLTVAKMTVASGQLWDIAGP